MTRLINPDQQYFDNDTGAPLALGTVYFGEPNQDPETNPKAVYADADLVTPLSPTQALTAAGKHQQAIYLDGEYSITVRDMMGGLINSEANFAGMVGRGAMTVGSIADILSLPAELRKSDLSYRVVGYHSGWAASMAVLQGGGVFVWHADMTKSSHDGGVIISPTVPWDGSVATLPAFLLGTSETDAAGTGCWVRVIDGTVTPQMFGAIANDDSQEVATANTEAFRRAFKSYKADWTAAKTAKRLWSVNVPDGDYNLSDGFTIPKGMTGWGNGMGASRIKMLGATDVADPLPLVSLGRVIDESTGATEVTTGAWVQDPAPMIDNLYLNPQNANTALSVQGVPGFKIGRLWIQALVAVSIGGGAGDGLIDELMIEDSTGAGIDFGDCQNLVIGSLYTFLTDNPLRFSGNSNNIDIGVLQANYTRHQLLLTNDSITANAVRIGRLICNQNAQYSTFVGVIRTRSSSCDIRIDDAEFRNYRGYAWNNETGLGNRLSFGRVKLRQAPSNSTYTAGTEAKGFRVNNAHLKIEHLDTDGLADSPVEMTGTFTTTAKILSAEFGTHATSNPVVNISNTDTGSELAINDAENKSGKALFNAQSAFVPRWRNVKKAFPVVTENARKAVKIPFGAKGELWRIGVVANTNPSGNSVYSKSAMFFVGLDVTYSNSALANHTAFQSAFSSSIGEAFAPQIALQVDIGSVGAGATVARTTSGHVVVSVPESYTNVQFDVELVS